MEPSVNVWRFGIREWRELDLPKFLLLSDCVCKVRIED